MIVCGLKLTHDSSVAIVDNGHLKFCTELEKLGNNNRFKIIDALDEIEQIINVKGYSLDAIDKFVVDGWVGEKTSLIKTCNLGSDVSIDVAPYLEPLGTDVLKKYSFKGLPIGTKVFDYESYCHVTNHILTAYWTSSFSAVGDDAYILVWDGGMYPTLYHYDFHSNRITSHGPLFYMGVNIYSIFAQHFGPFKINENVIKDELSMAGKVMAYVSYGSSVPEIIEMYENVYAATITKARDSAYIPQYPYLFTKEFAKLAKGKKFADEDVISSMHFFLERKLIDSLSNVIRGKNHMPNICLAGGAALNIKWNSSIRACKLFKDVWVPPFPNDSGSAIGGAIAGWMSEDCHKRFSWNIYTGPEVIVSDVPEGWSAEHADVDRLASLLYESNELLIILNGSAELGPRALGNRSILASPSSEEVKDKLNYLKLREHYRPIAPVCLEEMAQTIFDPGFPDPFMLFEHSIRPSWLGKIRAVAHVDNSARLQTVNENSNPFLYSLLKKFAELSGIPVLCNTSANFKGSGFFPDVASAARWGKINYIFSNGILYSKKNKTRLAKANGMVVTNYN